MDCYLEVSVLRQNTRKSEEGDKLEIWTTSQRSGAMPGQDARKSSRGSRSRRWRHKVHSPEGGSQLFAPLPLPGRSSASGPISCQMKCWSIAASVDPGLRLMGHDITPSLRGVFWMTWVQVSWGGCYGRSEPSQEHEHSLLASKCVPLYYSLPSQSAATVYLAWSWNWGLCGWYIPPDLVLALVGIVIRLCGEMCSQCRNETWNMRGTLRDWENWSSKVTRLIFVAESDMGKWSGSVCFGKFEMKICEA